MHSSILAPQASAGTNRGATKMRIVFFVPWITQSRGGTENVGHMMANAMAERGHDVHVFTFDDERRPSEWPLNPAIVLHHLETAQDAAADSRMVVAVAQVSPDLIVGLHMNRTFLCYVRCARKLGVPIVLSEHADPRSTDRLGTFDNGERLIAFHGATRVHVLIDEYRDLLPVHLREKTTVIPNTAPQPKSLSSCSVPGRKTVVTVSRIVERKNIGALIAAFTEASASFPDWDLKIVGEGPALASLRSQVKEIGMTNRIQFTGWQNPYDVLPTAQLFATTSLIEAFGLTALEAMAHGLPVIGFKCCSGINAQVTHGENGLLAALENGENDFSQQLLRAMQDDVLREKLGQNALKHFNAYYTKDVIVNQWEALFQDAAREKASISRPGIAQQLDVELDKLVFGDRILDGETQLH